MLVLKVCKKHRVYIIDTSTRETIGSIVVSDGAAIEYVRLGFEFDKRYNIVRDNANSRMTLKERNLDAPAPKTTT